MAAIDQLTPLAVDWAVAHIKRFGDTDLLPVPFEYEAIRHAWQPLRDYITQLDLSKHEARPARRFLIPKGGFSYRVAVQLDPIDTLVFTALAYELAPLVEQIRTPASSRVACSYRVDIKPEGDLFRKKNGWDDFHARGQELARDSRFKFVITADIADFYNQIGHHRVRNALETAGAGAERAKNVENLLMNLTGGQSRGIPVGPAASIVFAEACLADVDDMLLRKGYTHTRYVDDFRIFCADEEEAWRALHALTEYLYTSHRLTLQAHKTKLMSTESFIRTELVDPESLEDASIQDKLDAIADAIAMYSEGDEEFDEELDKNQLVRENLAELFELVMADDVPHYGLAKHLLRRATSLRTVVLRNLVLGNLEKLVPAYREAVHYLTAISKDERAREVGMALIDHALASRHKHLPYLHEWTADFLIKKCLPELSVEVQKYLANNEQRLGLRQIALAARQLGAVDWVRERKETWQNSGPWDKRAILWASQALSVDEMNYWLKRVQNTGDMLDRAIATAAAAIKLQT